MTFAAYITADDERTLLCEGDNHVSVTVEAKRAVRVGFAELTSGDVYFQMSGQNSWTHFICCGIDRLATLEIIRR